MLDDFSAVGLDFKVADGIAWLTMNRPQLRNAVDHPLRNALIAAIAEVRDEPEIRAAVITGAGNAFCSGADLSQSDHIEIRPDGRRGSPANIAREDGRRFGWWRLIRDLWENEKPFVAAVNGPAYGFGCNFALACDLVIAAESARFSEVFVNRGLPLEGAGAYLLARSVSPVRAKEIALLGEPVTGAQAEEWGLANRCVPDDRLIEVAGDFARRLAAGPTIGLGHIKGQLNDAYDSSFDQVCKTEVTLLGLGIGDDAQEAMQAFKERRAPRFRGR
ncbi:enoyl-CoA hydratase/isomerase family protein [Peterkaempfera bronchialis]|uniref:Enoyl-CoA hydratase/isomerase family protein n=1 Tax=Peterkaempfera bronchialis TaxID=2126346 RepID=A0A345SRD1_9ACTN|nr:enoyl-CoA hydratase-related protein [Peterkaempfera bronchialis]AXI76286.1 enoyl-CoA hydratase/isomerase family protein [Peterkaempfera bronchialis]